MPHPDADDLALFAMGEMPDAELAAHVVDCAQCSADVAQWQRTADLARQADLPGWVPPAPAGVWDAIVAELGLPTDTAGDAADSATAPQRSRWRRLAVPVAAGLAGLLAGAAVVIAVQRTPSPTVESSATLVGLPGAEPEVRPDQQVGAAELLAVDGRRELRVEAGALPGIPGSYEVWLIATPERMVSLGVLTDGAGTFPVPAGIDPAEYSLVDISNEPSDGNPAHSGDSIARGTLA